jgi:hypothetical protein
MEMGQAKLHRSRHPYQWTSTHLEVGDMSRLLRSESLPGTDEREMRGSSVKCPGVARISLPSPISRVSICFSLCTPIISMQSIIFFTITFQITKETNIIRTAHTRSHTNERPYICRLGCGKAFTRQSDLSRHEKKIHPDDKTSALGAIPTSPPSGLEDMPLPVSMGVLPVPGLHGHVDGAEGSVSAPPVKSGRGTRKRTRKTKGAEGHSVSASGDRRTRSSSPLHSSQLKHEVDVDADATDDQNPSGGGGGHEFGMDMDLSLDLGSGGGGILGPVGSGNGNGHGASMTLADVSLDLSMGTNGLGGMGMDDSGATMRRSHSASPPPSSPPPQRLAIFGPREPLRHRSD